MPYVLPTALEKDPNEASCLGPTIMDAVLAIGFYNNAKSITYELLWFSKAYWNVAWIWRCSNIHIIATHGAHRCEASDVFAVTWVTMLRPTFTYPLHAILVDVPGKPTASAKLLNLQKMSIHLATFSSKQKMTHVLPLADTFAWGRVSQYMGSPAEFLFSLSTSSTKHQKTSLVP